MAVQRSRPYPSISLAEAIRKIEEVVRKLGNSKKYDKNTFAQGLGYKSAQNGAFVRTSAALTQYNLIQREADEYSLSPLSQAILWPTNEGAREKAIQDAALSPQVFDLLYATYSGQELPMLLANILTAEYGILVGAKDKVVALFKATMEYAGLLQNNTLLDKEGETSIATLPDAEADPVEEYADLVLQSPAPRTPLAIATTSLTKDFGNGRVATLIIPTDLDDTEREKLANLIKNM